MMTENTKKLLDELNKGADQSRFPIWDIDEDYVFTGAMRVTGFSSVYGPALVFESFEYNKREGVIHVNAVCFSLFPPGHQRHYGNGIFINNAEFMKEDGELTLGVPCILNIRQRNSEYKIELTETDNVIGIASELDPSDRIIVSALCRIVESTPPERIFSTPDYLISAFKIPADARVIYTLENWEHPGLEIYEEGCRPGDYPDIAELASAVCERSQPQLIGKPNTHWRNYYVRNT